MKKILFVLMMLNVTSLHAWNDNENWAWNCYGDHDMSSYYLNDKGELASYPPLAYDKTVTFIKQEKETK